MIISFFGHVHFTGRVDLKNKILSFLEEVVGDEIAFAYLGSHGGFDDFAYECCMKYKAAHSNLSLVYVTPYMTLEYQQNHLAHQLDRYDGIIYPQIEEKPIRLAILYRNRFMIEQSDYVVVYITHDFGGAYSAYRYAKKQGKIIYNLADFRDN